MALPSAYAQYNNSKVLTASPAELTLMLYDGAIKFCNIAGIALMAVAAWLGEVGKNNKMFFFPMVFMLAATLTSLVITVINKCKAIGAGTAAWGDWFQLFFAAAMAVLAIFLVVEGAQTFAKQMKEKKAKKAA